MECDICGKEPQTKTRYHCSTCARTAIYPLRIEHATVLVEKDGLGKRLEAVVSGEKSQIKENATLDGAIVDIDDCHKAFRVEEAKSEAVLVADRIQSMGEKAADLRKKIEQHKKMIADMKAENGQRKSDAESANYGLDTRSAKQLDEVKKQIRTVRREWDEKHKSLVRDRRSLCRRAAKLAGLQKIRIVEGQKILEHYEIAAGLRVFDLREMNSKPRPQAFPENPHQTLNNLCISCRSRGSHRVLDTTRLPSEQSVWLSGRTTASRTHLAT
jgi:hypothetical protein